MAGDWIKMRTNLWDDPRVGAIVDATDSSEAAVIGALYWLWAMADQHTEDGIMPGLSLRQIDRKTGVKGLGEGLVSIGWLADHPEGVRIVPDDCLGPLFIVGVDRPRPFSGVWMRLRAQVFKRDGMRCVYCGATDVALECDHINPVALGGRHELENLATACRTCNRSKAAKPLSTWRAA